MLLNKLDDAWRDYSPGGKRAKITKIPFNGTVNNELRAMGTKRVPVVSASFMQAPPIPVYVDPNGVPRYDMPQQQSMPPLVMDRQQIQQSNTNRRPIQTGNRLYRSAIDTSKELRGWKRELDPTRQLLREQRLLSSSLGGRAVPFTPGAQN